jgi:Tfp pilus assembly protein PilO
MTTRLTPKTLALIMVAVIVLLGAGGWFGLVAQQRSDASSLAAKAADEQANLDAVETLNRTIGTTTPGKGKGKAKDAANQPALLAVAFPTEVAMPSILLQVQRLATESDVLLEAFAPTLPTPQSGYDSIPIDVKVTGRYRAIQKFVHALRAQAGSSGGRIHADGRLFAVETLGITAAADGLPLLTASILVDVFVFTGPPPATETPAGTETTTAEGTSE